MFENAKAGCIVDNLVLTIQAHKDCLSQIDGQTGDGDHGINMNKGFALCAERLKGTRYTMSEGFMVLSETLMEDIGGSMGPLYGVFFEEMGMLSKNAVGIHAPLFREMLAGATAAVQEIGGAKLGDKTLLDTLIPARDAYAAALNSNVSFSDCLRAMIGAAREGWQSTENMIAKVGRASRLGERSRGFLDSGATSCFLILESLANSMIALNGDSAN